MNVWLVGGGVYGMTLLFALALCRVASPADKSLTQTGGCATSPGRHSAEYERIVGRGAGSPDVVTHRETVDELPSNLPGSRPTGRLCQSRKPRTLSPRP